MRLVLAIATITACAGPAKPASQPAMRVEVRDQLPIPIASDVSRGTIFERLDCILGDSMMAQNLWFDPSDGTTHFCVQLAADDLHACYAVTLDGTYTTDSPIVESTMPDHRDDASEYLHEKGYVQNASGTLHAEWDPFDDGPHPIEVFDDRTRKRLGRFTAGTAAAACVSAAFVGDTLVVSEQDEAFRATAWLASPTGRRLAPLGGATPLQTLRLGPVHIAGPVWSFASSDADVVVLQDVVTGRVRQTMRLGEAGRRADMVGDADHLVVIYGGDRTGEIAVIDVATGAIAHHAPKRCSRAVSD